MNTARSNRICFFDFCIRPLQTQRDIDISFDQLEKQLTCLAEAPRKQPYFHQHLYGLDDLYTLAFMYSIRNYCPLPTDNHC